MRLIDLTEGQEAVILKIYGRGAFRKRLIEMGFVRGKKIKVTKFAPLKDPVEYNIMGYEVSLRKMKLNWSKLLQKKKLKKK